MDKWERSTFCSDTSCVEVLKCERDMIKVRNAKDPGKVLSFTMEEWLAFRVGVQAGEFNFDA